MSGERVRTYLMEHGARYEVRTHPKAFTIGETAEAEHVLNDVFQGQQVLDAGKSFSGRHGSHPSWSATAAWTTRAEAASLHSPASRRSACRPAV